jgi:hypothetical protein
VRPVYVRVIEKTAGPPPGEPHHRACHRQLTAGAHASIWLDHLKVPLRTAECRRRGLLKGSPPARLAAGLATLASWLRAILDRRLSTASQLALDLAELV